MYFAFNLQFLRSLTIVFVSSAFVYLPIAQAETPAPVYSQNGMVVSASNLASDSGIAILKSGGNAFDAAVAVGFTLAVTYPMAGNIGGGGFLVAVKERDQSVTLDFRETAPAAAHRDMYLDEQGNVIEGLSLRSSKASGVPGTVLGLLRI